MNHPPFIHLHLHSQFSLLESTVRMEPLMARLKEFQMPTAALTDKANLFGAISFYQSAIAHGLKPILGCEIWVSSNVRNGKTGPGHLETAYPLVLLAENEAGYQNLMKLSSEGYLGEFQQTPHVNKAFLAGHCQGLIALSGGEPSEINSLILKDETPIASRTAEEYGEIFGKGRFFLEIQNHRQAFDVKTQKALVELSAKTSIPLVAANDVKYLKREESVFHEVLLCLGKGQVLSDPKHYSMGTSEYYLKSAPEMAEAFAEIPQAVAQTWEIAERCHVSLEFGKTLMPAFPVPEKGSDENAYLEKICREGLAKRYGEHAQDPAVQDRLKEELSVIKKTGFSGYFLIVWDFIAKARQKNIRVGPGRGSAAGSLVSYVTGITEVDPIRYDLLFERFINPERVSAPDIDVDVCDRRRGEVLRYMTETYGKDRVASIVTFGTMAAKAAIRDVGRVLEVPLHEVDRIAKLIPGEPKMTLEDALERAPELRAIAHDEFHQYRKLWDVSRALEGLVRHVSTHAAGIIIGNEPLLEKIPICRGSNNEALSQYDMNALKDVGLLKLDILGLRTLSVIDDTLRAIEQHRKIKLNLSEISLEDEPTFKLLQDAKTIGVFQLESRGMRDYMRKLEPSHMEDLIALNALYRPGPLGSDMVDDFIHRKKGLVKVQYSHPKLEPILKTTYGVILYQEQVMRIAKELAGFSLGQADLLRRAMGSKNSEKMEKMRSRFLSGAHEAKIPKETADAIFDQMAKFAGYGFNKSHSAAYAFLAYQTAYLKTHFTPEFIAALLTSESGRHDKISQYIFECKKMNIRVLPPDVNESSDIFEVTDQGIRFSLSAIKNVGTPAVEAILKARKDGPYQSLSDFCQRVDLRTLTPKMLECLIASGAFDFTKSSRSALKTAAENIFRRAQVEQADTQAGQTSLFETPKAAAEILEEGSEESPAQALMAEKELLGFYLSGHPLSEHEWELEHYVMLLNELEEMPDGFEVRVAGLIRSISKSVARKSQEVYARFTLEDLHSHVEVIAWPEVFKKYQSLLEKDKLVGIKGRLDKSGDGLQIFAREMIDMNEMAAKWAKGVKLTLSVVGMDEHLLPSVKAVCERYKGEAKVYFHMQTTHHGLMVLEAADLRVTPSKAFFEEIYSVLGDDSVEIEL
jgi:DNA polymerase-3 subunit alpha